MLIFFKNIIFTIKVKTHGIGDANLALVEYYYPAFTGEKTESTFYPLSSCQMPSEVPTADKSQIYLN